MALDPSVINNKYDVMTLAWLQTDIHTLPSASWGRTVIEGQRTNRVVYHKMKYGKLPKECKNGGKCYG